MFKADLEIHKIKNLTNGIDLIKATSAVEYEMTEFSIEQISLILPKLVGHGLLVTIDSTLHLGTAKHPFVITGKITSCTTNLENAFLVVIELHDIDRELWDEFNKVRNLEQKRIKNLLEKLKG